MSSAFSRSVTRFEAYCRGREQDAASTAIPGFRTVAARTSSCSAGGPPLVQIESPWTSAALRRSVLSQPHRTILSVQPVSLVFVQSRDRQHVADNPSTLGGGDTDLHLIYEGLSRVDADAVLAGATTARGDRMVFSIWHPGAGEVAAGSAATRAIRRRSWSPIARNLKIERALMFQEPSCRCSSSRSRRTPPRCRIGCEIGPGSRCIDAGEPLSLPCAA